MEKRRMDKYKDNNNDYDINKLRLKITIIIPTNE